MLFAVLFVASALAGAELKPAETNGLHVIRVSKSQWTDICNSVETNGYCRIPDQCAAIVITNDVPQVELKVPIHQPIGRGPERKNPYYEFRRLEPLPYVGQSW